MILFKVKTAFGRLRGDTVLPYLSMIRQNLCPHIWSFLAPGRLSDFICFMMRWNKSGIQLYRLPTAPWAPIARPPTSCWKYTRELLRFQVKENNRKVPIDKFANQQKRRHREIQEKLKYEIFKAWFNSNPSRFKPRRTHVSVSVLIKMTSSCSDFLVFLTASVFPWHHQAFFYDGMLNVWEEAWYTKRAVGI